MQFISKRSLLGALLFLILAGEPTVGVSTGLFTVPGFIVLFLLYFCFFHLLDALVAQYRVNALGIILLTFALYSVLITGLLHAELLDYVTHPHTGLVISLIRMQASLYTVFAFCLLAKLAPRKQRQQVSLKAASMLFALFVLVLTLTRRFGLIDLWRSFHGAPVISLTFSIVALLCVIIGLRCKVAATKKAFVRGLSWWSVVFLITAVFPFVIAFAVLVVGMIVVTGYYLTKPTFRSMSVT
jgi:hypothetical protein